MDTIVLADSTKSQIEQIIGRIGRNQSERDLHIHDIFDRFHFTAKHFSARKKVYEKKGYVDAHAVPKAKTIPSPGPILSVAKVTKNLTETVTKNRTETITKNRPEPISSVAKVTKNRAEVN